MILRGQDYDITITLETEDETAVKPSELEQLYIYIVHIRRGSILAKYSLNAKLHYYGIEVLDDAAGQVKIIFNHTETTYAPIGPFKLEILGRKADADYVGSDQDYICTLVDPDWYVSDTRIKVE